VVSDLVNTVVPQHGEVVSEVIDIRGHFPARSPSHAWRILVKTPGDIGSSGGGRVGERVRVREITNQEGNRLLRIVRPSTDSVVTWRRAQMVLLSAQGIAPALAIAAAIGLVLIQVGGISLHLSRGEARMIGLNVVLLVLAGVEIWLATVWL
jgi:hypothetical protein